jgi:hypothetical protein
MVDMYKSCCAAGINHMTKTLGLYHPSMPPASLRPPLRNKRLSTQREALDSSISSVIQKPGIELA